jgi:hypothetical protein
MKTLDESDDTANGEQTQQTTTAAAPIDSPVTVDRWEDVLGLLRDRFRFSR